MTPEFTIEDEILEVIDNEFIHSEQVKIIGEKRKRTESEISENQFQTCKEEYLGESDEEAHKDVNVNANHDTI
jgi:hypothetical protein